MELDISVIITHQTAEYIFNKLQTLCLLTHFTLPSFNRGHQSILT